ncbi:MAG: type II toxin-antitoxin system prevent-host-death family antitoxin [Patescibacteria group bacterium]|nr:type II toxin-antitoxin system prevent-host-death family antitoxin [Patescibacteria group bacterium]
MLKVEVDKILPVTEARAKIALVVDEVAKGNIYVLTRGGKPIVAVAPIKYFNNIKTEEMKAVSKESKEPMVVAKQDKTMEIVKEKPKKLKLKEEPEEAVEAVSKNDDEDLPAGIDLGKVEKALAQVNYQAQ